MTITPMDPPWSEEIAEDFRHLMPPGMPPLNLFRVLAHNPRVLRRVRRGGLLDPGSITPRQREIVILRTCALCGCAYEWGVHVGFFAQRVGLSPEEVQATTSLEIAELWLPEDALILEMCDALHERAQITDELAGRLATAFTEAQRVELLTLAGLYHAVAYVANAARVPLEAGAPPFPG